MPETPQQGILARFVNRVSRQRAPRAVTVAAAVAEYQKGDYLKNPDTSYLKDYGPVSGVPKEIKFHRGFYRRPQAAINQDEERLRTQAASQERREQIVSDRLQAFEQQRQVHTFNIISATGVGRENEDAVTGVRKVNQESLEREKLAKYRIKNSISRFHDTSPETPAERLKKQQVLAEGMNNGKESVVIGVPPGNLQRRVMSNGAYDLYAHTQIRRVAPPHPLAPPRARHASQIVFG